MCVIALVDNLQLVVHRVGIVQCRGVAVDVGYPFPISSCLLPPASSEPAYDNTDAATSFQKSHEVCWLGRIATWVLGAVAVFTMILPTFGPLVTWYHKVTKSTITR